MSLEKQHKIIKEIQLLKEGCGKRIDSNGDCAYYSSRGNLRLCPKCRKRFNKLKEEFANLENQEISNDYIPKITKEEEKEIQEDVYGENGTIGTIVSHENDGVKN